MSAVKFVARHEADWRGCVRDLDSLRLWMAEHGDEIDRNPAAFCAIESALLDLISRESGRTLEEELGLAAGEDEPERAAVLEKGPLSAFIAGWILRRLQGALSFEVKLSGDPARDRRKAAVARLLAPPGARLRLHPPKARCSVEEAARALEAWRAPAEGVEEPLSPPGRYWDLARLAEGKPWKIILNESLVRLDQMRVLEEDPSRWMIRVCVSKMGGVLRSLQILARARALGIPVIVGREDQGPLASAARAVARAAGLPRPVPALPPLESPRVAPPAPAGAVRQ